MDNIFIQLAIILSAVCVIGFFIFRLRLPLVVAFLLAGVSLSAFNAEDSSILHTLPELGIALVLFLIGMELNLTEIRSLGKPVFFATVFQAILSSLAGYGVATLFGFSGTDALILGIGLAFSSTVVIVKMLLEKRDLASLYGKLSIGILLVEDLIAILVMTAITSNIATMGFGMEQVETLLIFGGKALGLITLALVSSRYILQPVFHAIARSIELLFLVAITWCFVFTSLAVVAGLSVVVGAFLAGVALASSPYQLQIQGRIKPLRDFFVALFFVYVGSQVSLTEIINVWPIILAFTALALFVKPIIYLTGLSFFNFRKHTLFQTSLNMSQVSEFSLIIVLLGVEFGLASESILSIIAGSAVLSIIISSVLMTYAEELYKIFKPFVTLFQRKEIMDILPQEAMPSLTGHVVVIGADRVGRVVIEHLKKSNIETIVLDYNPALVRSLRANGFRTIYGDLSDPEIIENLQLERAHLIISTANGHVDTMTLLEACRTKKTGAIIIVRTSEPDQEQTLIDNGAHYVILPERVTGDFLVSKLEDEWPNLHFSKN